MTALRAEGDIIAAKAGAAAPALLGALVFALKTLGASLLALFLAFWLGLDEPKWALLTVFVVSQPDSGLVLAKSFYRIVGTIAGTLASIALVFTLAQHGELFLLALAAWVGLCNFAARAERNFASYGFLLAGYTVGVVGIPAALNPSSAYPLVLARFTEICLGIACAALVSRLIFPNEVGPKLVAMVRDLSRQADGLAAAVLMGRDGDALAAVRTRLVRSFATVGALQAAAFFESAEARLLDRPLRRVTEAAIGVVAAAEEAAASDVSVSSCAELSSRPAAPHSTATVGAARLRLAAAAASLDRHDRPPPTETTGSIWVNPRTAGLIGLRSALAVALTGTIWIATAWPSGATAVIIATVVCSLAASMKGPVRISLALAVTVLIAAVPVFATLFYAVPLASDFPSLAGALAPLLLACGFVMAQPGIGPLGVLAATYFASSSNIDNVMTYDPSAFLNTSLAILVGIVVAVILFAVFFPDTPEQAVRNFRRQMLSRLGPCAARSDPTIAAYERALYDQLAGTLERLDAEPKLAQECIMGAAAALSIARAVGRVRVELKTGHLPPEFANAGSDLLADLSQTCRRPTRVDVVHSAMMASSLRRRVLALAAGTDPAARASLSALASACETLRSSLLPPDHLLPEHANVR